ncbi:hypothetical protein J4E93_002249 [Alternaria ventricosa]|uniref:uncharacterized protein n=1 Tax=Alternaria ventricosa TaxID=1187951 RepID=UPI0020C35331|nr:uncharacterized protein J4E93_002249 [Alternaria ventricosa]KAI4652052.1 hypothetical protein J4E93_002249 [Alternaria ventricosa]
MASGFDKLLEFLLSEIALRGIQGATSADFRHFVETFYKQGVDNGGSKSDDGDSRLPSAGLGRAFYERLWQWLTDHPDIRIVYQREVRQFTLSEFEAAELHETGTIGETSATGLLQSSDNPIKAVEQPSKSLFALRDSLRQHILGDQHDPQDLSTRPPETPIHPKLSRPRRNLPDGPHRTTAVFDDPSPDITAPRLYASQSRVWQALTGHGIDLKKVPAMEFVLLSLIAARGSAGITQPELINVSGQDKRSVPHRTDELARKNYISKISVQSNKMRTSLCIHNKFVSQNTFIESSAVEDVYQEDGTFVVRNFAQLLYNKVGQGGIVPTRSIREKLGVPMSSWNKRATQGAIIRLDQTGMIKRRRVRKKKSADAWITCIQVMRAPQDEDVRNLGFRRTAPITTDAKGELRDEDVDGDSLLNDLNDDMPDDPDANVIDRANAQPAPDQAVSIPPQWTPDRFLPNMIFNAAALAGAQGWDAEVLRNRIVGPFWRRPIESYFTRVTNDWEKTQPFHLRHLAVIRDAGNTKAKKFVHYLYRTYENFQKAVDDEIAVWEGVSVPGKSAKSSASEVSLDAWGFPTVSAKDLVRKTGAATLSEAGLAIVKPRKNGPRWDNGVAEQIGYQKHSSSMLKPTTSDTAGRSKKQKAVKVKPARVPKAAKASKTPSTISLTPEQKTKLGLHRHARLSRHVQNQILAHREKTGDPSAIPDSIEHGSAKRPLAQPLMTAEERIAKGIAPKGRMPMDVENAIREERGLPVAVKKVKKRATKSATEPTVLSNKQRIAMGWSCQGRIPDDIIDGLRQERKDGIPLEKSNIIAIWDAEMKDRARRKKEEGAGSTKKQASPCRDKDVDVSMENPEADYVPGPTLMEPGTGHVSPEPVTGKRKAKDVVATPRTSKRRLTKSTVSQRSESRTVASMSPSPTDVETPPRNAASPVRPDDHSGKSTTVHIARPLTKTYVPLDASKLDARARGVVDQYDKRCSPGLFLNPHMKQKVARGRPRKALMATFKLPHLADLDWFMTESEQEQGAIQAECSQTPQSMQTSVTQRDGETTQPPQGILADTVPEPHIEAPLASLETIPQNLTPAQTRSPSPMQPQSPIEIQTQQDVLIHGEPSVSARQSILLDSEPSQDSNEVNKEEATSSVPDAMAIRSNGVVPGITTGSANAEEPSDVSPKPGRNQLLQTVVPTPRMVGGWAAINATERTRMTPYQSPYAASPSPVAQSSPAPVPEASSGAPPPNAVHSAIVETPVPTIPGTKPRKAQRGGIAGTQRTLRQNLILEIIKMCGGVFPGGGEMPRPFLTLWEERHPNIPKPSPSTITETLRNMSVDPKFGLKHWNFASQHQNMPGTAVRRMYTWAHLNERSPEVLKLAHNMAQYSQVKDYNARRSEKSLLYYPKEIRDLIGEVVSHQPIEPAPKDESIILNQLNPELERQITEAKLRKRSVWSKQKRLEAKARKAQNAQVEQASSKQLADGSGAPRTKRARLASLNDKSKKLRRAPLYTANMGAFDEDSDDMADDEVAAATAAKSGPITLIWTRPIVAPVPEREHQSDEEPPEDDESDEEMPALVTQQAPSNAVSERDLPPVEQPVVEDSTGGVTADEPDSTGADKVASLASSEQATDGPANAKKSKKRVRIAAPRDQSSRKRVRISLATSTTAPDVATTVHSSTDGEAQSGSEDEDEPEDNNDTSPSKTKKPRIRNFGGRQRGRPGPTPTLLERLTGLTGDPNDPIYQPPQRAPRPGRAVQTWRERKRTRINRFKEERQYARAADTLDDFKKLFYTFVVVSSLSGNDQQIDWCLFKNVHTSNRFFDVVKAKKLWSWMQMHMAEQIRELTTTFQSLYLEAYETGKVASIEDPETHDWASLIQWAMRKCAYPDLPLPVLRQALQQFDVDESNYEIMDRVLWYKAATADRTRTMLQLQQSFTAPLHRSRKATWSSDDKLLKARSWIRANTATPQALYNANLAHEKFEDLGETILVNVVGDLVDKQHIRMRKLKRLLPGRNYNFTQALAKKYTRLFQLDDFMNAVAIKKKMDAAFADEDPGFYNMSRCEDDGAFAAIMTMVNEGTVKLVPQLPPVNSDFDAALPKLSKWGFCEGGYNHRAIDRARLFWDIHVVPTASYKFGNPLQPLATPPSSMDDVEPAVWSALPEPPLPGKNDAGALLPIWSSIDGQSVTWPWWYRVLNLVLQPLIFLAGATAADIHSHCPEHTTELFEIELVLDWLQSVNAVKKTIGGGYITLPGFWAAFGDHLRDTEGDWFGEHVKRKAKNHEKQRWRVDYNLRLSTLQARKAVGTDATPVDAEGAANVQDIGPLETSTSREILKNPKQQYRIMHRALNSEQSHAEKNRSDPRPASRSATPQIGQEPVADPTTSGSHTPAAANTPSEDVEMVDADVDAEGEEDIDAEGEIDDDMY